MKMAAISNLKPANFGTQSDMGELGILLGLDGIIQLNTLELVQMILIIPVYEVTKCIFPAPSSDMGSIGTPTTP